MEQATSSAQLGFPSSIPQPSPFVIEKLNKPFLSRSCLLRSWPRPRADPKSTMDTDLAKLPRSSGHAASPPWCLRSPAQNLQAVLDPSPNHVAQAEGGGEHSYLGDLLCPRALCNCHVQAGAATFRLLSLGLGFKATSSAFAHTSSHPDSSGPRSPGCLAGV